MVEGLDTDKLRDFRAERSIHWLFTAPAAPHQNACAEALIKSCKLALKKAIGEQALSPFKLYTCLLEVENLVNQRPIGRVPNDPDEGKYWCPNDVLLERATRNERHGKPATLRRICAGNCRLLLEALEQGRTTSCRNRRGTKKDGMYRSMISSSWPTRMLSAVNGLLAELSSASRDRWPSSQHQSKNNSRRVQPSIHQDFCHISCWGIPPQIIRLTKEG